MVEPRRHMVDLAEGALEVWSSSESREGAGVLYPYGGGALKVGLRFVPLALEWDTGTGVGIERLSDPAKGEPQGRLGIFAESMGASDLPTRSLLLAGSSGTDFRDDRVGLTLTPGEEYRAEFEPIHGLGRVYYQLADSTGEPLATTQRDFGMPLRRGDYMVGNPGVWLWRYGDGSQVSRMRLTAIEVWAGRAIRLPAVWQPS